MAVSEYVRQQMSEDELKIMRKVMQKEFAGRAISPKELTEWTSKYDTAFYAKQKKQFDAARAKSKLITVEEKAFDVKRKKRRGRAQTVLSRGMAGRPGLLNLLSGSSSGSLLGFKTRLGE